MAYHGRRQRQYKRDRLGRFAKFGYPENLARGRHDITGAFKRMEYNDRDASNYQSYAFDNGLGRALINNRPSRGDLPPYEIASGFRRASRTPARPSSTLTTKSYNAVISLRPPSDYQQFVAAGLAAGTAAAGAIAAGKFARKALAKNRAKKAVAKKALAKSQARKAQTKKKAAPKRRRRRSF